MSSDAYMRCKAEREALAVQLAEVRLQIQTAEKEADDLRRLLGDSEEDKAELCAELDRVRLQLQEAIRAGERMWQGVDNE